MTTTQDSAIAFPRLSLPERDRRYAAVRERMARRQIDCIVVRSDSSKWDAGSAEGRYLTHIGGNGEDGYVVLGHTEPATFIIWGPDHVANWREFQDWTWDIRPYAPAFATQVANRVRELGAEKGTVGLVGRQGSRLYRGEGRWPQGNYEALRRELPDVTFVDFDEDLWSVLEVKSPEEIACIERATEITEAGFAEMLKAAVPGARVKEVVGRLLWGMVSAGSDMSIQAMVSAAPRTPRVAGRLYPERVLQRGDIIINEITGKYLGYAAQIHGPVSVGQAPGAVYQALFEVVREAFLAGEQVLRPGINTIDLAEAVRGPVMRSGYSTNVMPLFKGMGLTIAEHPYSPVGVGVGPGGKPVGQEIREGMVLLFEPAAWDEANQAGIHVAQQVVVTATGSRRLGRRALELVST